MPHGIYGGSCVLINNSIYYFGGKVLSGAHTSSIMKYSIEENIWIILDATLSSSYFGSQAILLNNTNVFILGGAVSTNNHSPYGGYPSCGNAYNLGGYCLLSGYSGIQNFDILTESISSAGNMNLKRYAPQIALVNGHIYIAGGLSINSPSSGSVLSDSIMSMEIWTDDQYITTTTSTSEPTTTVTSPTNSFTSTTILSSVVATLQSIASSTSKIATTTASTSKIATTVSIAATASTSKIPTAVSLTTTTASTFNPVTTTNTATATQTYVQKSFLETCIYRYDLFNGLGDFSISYDMNNEKMQIKISA
eukprot:145065_1